METPGDVAELESRKGPFTELSDFEFDLGLYDKMQEEHSRHIDELDDLFTESDEEENNFG